MADNFTPGETVGLNATTSSGSVSFTLAQSASYPDVLITNTGTVVAFIGINGAAATSGANATPILPSEQIVLHKGIGATSMSGITASGSAQLYFTAGEGS